MKSQIWKERKSQKGREEAELSAKRCPNEYVRE
jgi:hypothetical protein